MNPMNALKHRPAHLLGAVLLILALALGVSAFVGRQGGAPAEAGVLDVRSFAADPSAYEGSLKVRGVVSRVFPSRSTFLMIDYREYKACGIVTCAAVALPVRYSGDMPKPMEEIVATGEVVSAANGFVFEAQQVRKLGE